MRERFSPFSESLCFIFALSPDVLRSSELVLAAEELRAAILCLGQITGRVRVDDLLDVIFRDFCVGTFDTFLSCENITASVIRQMSVSRVFFSLSNQIHIHNIKHKGNALPSLCSQIEQLHHVGSSVGRSSGGGDRSGSGSDWSNIGCCVI